MDPDDLDDSTVIGASAEDFGELSKDRAYLIVIAGTQVGEMIALKESTVLGRGGDADVRLVEEKMSRRHCRLFIEGGEAFIEDLGSSNGTFVNGKRIESQKLSDGDKIQVGETTILKFTYNDQLEENFQRQMYDSALRDGLTKIFNKKYFHDRLGAEFAFTQRHRTPLSLILFDIDHFKKVNDTRGHLAGDRVLTALAAHVLKLVRTEDVFARYGGEEFAVLCRQTEVSRAQTIAERIRASVQQLEIVFGNERIPITVSVGVAMIPDRHIGSVDDFIGVTDAALYEAKRGGRNRVVARPLT
ncbi:MAG: GGDEF domain-containing protein [Deltaproteobacteria bacterium]|nr:GGDEF domain-containing protein [Deltaproteobacteria bacterium]MDQ3297481.1 GGDEF domain-containing protein [Myxococcota bacterium]